MGYDADRLLAHDGNPKGYRNADVASSSDKGSAAGNIGPSRGVSMAGYRDNPGVVKS